MAAARLILYIPHSLDTENTKSACVDVLCAAGNDAKTINAMLNRIEQVVLSAGVDKVVVNIQDWRVPALESILNTSGYFDNSGFLLESPVPFLEIASEEDEGGEITKKCNVTSEFVPSMIIGFEKEFESNNSLPPSTSSQNSVANDILSSLGNVLESNVEFDVAADPMVPLIESLFTALHAESDMNSL